jgi:membrane fusion protein (multidrug efflux system)
MPQPGRARARNDASAISKVEIQGMDTVADNVTDIRSGQRPRRASLHWVLMVAGLLLAGTAGLWYYWASGRYVSTDDSFVHAAQTSISANVSGRVVELEVRDNQSVYRGEVLYRLDPRPFQIALEDRRAKLTAARLQIRACEATYRQELADLVAARATLAYQQHEFKRQRRLLQSSTTSRAQFEQVKHVVELARAQLASAQQQAASVLAMLGGDPDLPVDEHPAVQQARAALDQAILDLSYTVVRAPDDGVVAKVEQLQAGDYVNAATAVFSLISSDDVWVEANFKEDELTDIRPGQPAEVRVDSYPSHRFKAHVVSLSPGTGSQLSVLPPENATGNWVKVVQRVPVRVQLDRSELGDALPLHAGLSAKVTVDTRTSSQPVW